VGAWFDLVFSAMGKRYEGRIALLGRAGYLQYHFDWPRTLLSSDRRLWKRYPYRPRENVYVTAQDNEIPCNGLTGAVTNLSQGGFLFRVDRMVRLEDGLPVRPWAGLFAQGKVFSMVRIYGLTRSDILEARGVTVRVEEADSHIHLAVQFQWLADADRLLLTTVLEGRERKSVPAQAPADRTDRVTASGTLEAPEAAEPEAAPQPEEAGSELLRSLDRRTARVLVVAAQGEAEPILRHLQANGYWRLETAADPSAALEAFSRPAASPFRLLVADLEPACRAGLETVGAVRQMEHVFGAFGGLPVAFVTGKADAMLDLLDKPELGVVAREDPDAARCNRVLDRLLKI
jgi:hypothetical protein